MRFIVLASILASIEATVRFTAAPPAPQPELVFRDIRPKSRPENRAAMVRMSMILLKEDALFENLAASRAIFRLPTADKYEDVGKWLRENLCVEPYAKQGKIRITFTDGARWEQVAILKAFAGAHLKQHDAAEKDTSRVFLKLSLSDHVKALKDLADAAGNPENFAREQMRGKRIEEIIDELRRDIAAPSTIAIEKVPK